MVSAPPKIELLPENLIDQIKAGEVIERPGNLLKEILENALDAGASKLELHLRNNGLDLISLKDNGHGMRFEDLPLAFSRHATSKITRFEDLYRLRSFGFRGEALASISSISRLQCLTAVPDTSEGSEIRIEGGHITYHGHRRAQGHGTELVIQDLFFNTPARLKFIQSQTSERNFIRKVIFAFVLSNPKVEFHIKFDDEEKEIFLPALDLRSRFLEVLPKGKEQLLSIEKFYEDNELELYLVPGSVKGPLKLQYVFINNRFVLDKQLHRVLLNSLGSAMGHDDFHYLAFFSMPGDTIDVNVHPSKTVIKCLESSKLVGLLSSSVKELAKGTKGPALPSRSSFPSSSSGEAQSFELGAMPSLSQERHEYNLEGHFSPHSLPTERSNDLDWISGGFILKVIGGKHFAFSGKKLLEKYVEARLEFSSPTLPLLVSEPYPSKGVIAEKLERLRSAGVELEELGAETLVLRGIPEWMNGFPLKGVLTCLLYSPGFSGFEFQEVDWSSSTIIEMISTFSIDELLRERIAVDLAQLIGERLR